MPVYAVAAVLEDGWWNSAQGRTDFQLHMAQVEAALRPYLQRGGVLTVEGGRDSSAGMCICTSRWPSRKIHQSILRCLL
jgi:hypothetical protein